MHRSALRLAGLFAACAVLFSACFSTDDELEQPAANGTTTSAVTEPPSTSAGGVTGTTSGDGNPAAPPSTTGNGTSGNGTSGNNGGPDEPLNPVYADPRGERFNEFQRGFDRTHPFGSLEAFCLPHDTPTELLRDTDEGISAEQINFVHLRTKIEEVAALGFAEDVGDVQHVFDTFTAVVNNECGGVWGRRINLEEIEIPTLSLGGQDIETLRNAACIEATESRSGVILLNTTSFQGTAVLCVVEEHDAALIGSLPFPEEYLERGEGRLITLAAAEAAYLRELARHLIDTGALADRRVAIVAPNTPGQIEAVRSSLLSVLEAAGVDVAVFDVIDCAGDNICFTGINESVQRLISERVDVLFPTLNVLSLPSYISEMITQGIHAGDVLIYNSDFNSQGNDVVSSKVAEFGGPQAGELYDGTIMAVTGDVGNFRDPDYEPSPFDEMCMRTYAENSSTDYYDPRDPVETHKYAMVGLVCSAFRTALRALYDAGPNPSREDIFSALENLGAVDVPSMLPASLSPGKWSAADAFQTVTFEYPCSVEGTGTGRAQTCLIPNSDIGWLWLDR